MIIGLTGGIASGKSTVSKYLAEKGFKVYDADKIAKDISCLLYTSDAADD